MRIRAILVLILLAVADTLAAQATNGTGATAAQQDQVAVQGECPTAEWCLRIGVRNSAMPFSYYSRTVEKEASSEPAANTFAKSGPLRAEGFDGYMVYICDEVLKQLMIPGTGAPALITANQIEVIDVDNEMIGKPRQDRFNLLGTKIDMLCDPATISLERVRSYAVSPPLFLTGIGFLTRRDSVPPPVGCRPNGPALIGVVGTTNAATYGIQAIIDAGEWIKYRDLIVAALKGDTDQSKGCKAAGETEKVGGIIWAGSTHAEVARQFCNGNIDYYVGDLEIILRHARAVPGCDPVPSAQSFTNDRYAIFARIDYENEWKALRIGRFFEVLNREIATSDSLLDRAYLAEFGKATQSRKLELFFWSLRGAP